MPEISDEPKVTTALKWLGVIIPLIVLTTTPVLYLAGITYDGTMLEHYRLGDLALDKTVQQIVTQGFYGLILGLPKISSVLLLLAFTLAYASVWTVVLLLCAYILKSMKLVPQVTRYVRVSFTFILMSRVIIAVVIAFVIFVLIALPAIYASNAAKQRLGVVDKTVSSGCGACAVYRTRTGDLMGISVAGDKNRIIVAESDGAHVVKLDDLIAVIPPESELIKRAARR